MIRCHYPQHPASSAAKPQQLKNVQDLKDPRLPSSHSSTAPHKVPKKHPQPHWGLEHPKTWKYLSFSDSKISSSSYKEHLSLQLHTITIIVKKHLLKFSPFSTSAKEPSIFLLIKRSQIWKKKPMDWPQTPLLILPPESPTITLIRK